MVGRFKQGVVQNSLEVATFHNLTKDTHVHLIFISLVPTGDPRNLLLCERLSLLSVSTQKLVFSLFSMSTDKIRSIVIRVILVLGDVVIMDEIQCRFQDILVSNLLLLQFLWLSLDSPLSFLESFFSFSQYYLIVWRFITSGSILFKFFEYGFQIYLLYLVLRVEIVSPLPLTQIQNGEEDPKDHDAWEV